MQPPQQDPFTYTNNTDRYTDKEFYGIMVDTGASYRSTAGYGQYLAYKRLSNTNIDTTQAGVANVQFGIGQTASLSLIIINTLIGNIDFHVV